MAPSLCAGQPDEYLPKASLAVAWASSRSARWSSLTGMLGLGKGLLQCNLIAHVTTGRDWPDGSPGPAPGRVIILTAEDRKEDYRHAAAPPPAPIYASLIFDCVTP